MPSSIRTTPRPIARLASIASIALAVWLAGYLVSCWYGCDPATARVRSVSFILSWLAGWLVAMAASGAEGRANLRQLFLPCFPFSTLEPKAVPYGFSDAIRVAMPICIVCGLIWGLILNIKGRFKGRRARERAEAAGPPVDR